ncbi:MAG: flavodoxin family protein [Endomicrobiales bacterium]
MKTLVVYYSLTGKTEHIAGIIARETGADIRKVEDARKRSLFFAYITGSFEALRGRETLIKPVDLSLSGYDRVLVCAPVWAGNPAPAMNSFVAGADFTGKNVALLMTMSGREAPEAVEKLAARVRRRGGKVIRSFMLQTTMRSEISTVGRAKEIARILLK